MTFGRRSRRHGDRPGFTLVEMLVVIGILGLVIGLMFPVIGIVRERSRTAVCQNNLRNLAQGANEYHARRGSFPGGMEQRNFDSAPQYRGKSVFVELLPALERSDLYRVWDLGDPLTNTDGGTAARTAIVINSLVCPSDGIMINPINEGRWIYALTSYGGNGGSVSYPPQEAKTDGIFHTTGPGSEPKQQQRGVSLVQVKDGAPYTILFGERRHDDPNYESFVAVSWGENLSQWGWWGASGGRKAIGHVTMSAQAAINEQTPFSYANRATASPSAANVSDFQYYVNRRLSAFGSGHAGGANFAFVDGSVRFLSDAMPQDILRTLCTRAGRDTKDVELWLN